MIFVTVGTHHDPFTRLIDALALLPADEELVVQHGRAPAPPEATRAMPFVSFGEMLDCFRAARVVITHAGVGSVLCASRVGHTPLVVPRLARYGEHVDDHQSELVRALAPEGNVIPVWEMSDLPDLVASAPPRGEERQLTSGPLQREVRRALHEPR